MTGKHGFEKLYEIVKVLRSPNGCAWDREQTVKSLRSDLIEETYECIEAIDEENSEHIKEELGDIFLLAAMLSYMHEEKNIFTVDDVLEGVCGKLISRHPHVFGENTDQNLSTKEILENWARIKVEQENKPPKDSIMDEVKKGLPPLDRARDLQKKAGKAGFDWPNASGVIDKIKEELEETEAAMREEKESGSKALEMELGDLLFSVVNLCRFLKVDPSLALNGANNKFTERFRYVERNMRENKLEMKFENMEQMERFWNKAKTAAES